MKDIVDILLRPLVFIWLLSGAPAWAADEVMVRFGALQAQFLDAEAGAEEQIETVVAGLAALLKADPSNPVFHVYHGAAVALQSRTTLLPWKKIGFANEGLTEIDAALKGLSPEHDRRELRGVPLSLEARLVAAGTFLALPESFERRGPATELLRQIQASPAYAKGPAAFRAATLIRMAELDSFNEKPAERLAHLREAASLDPAGPYGKRANQLLSEAK